MSGLLEHDCEPRDLDYAQGAVRRCRVCGQYFKERTVHDRITDAEALEALWDSVTCKW